DTVAGFVAAGAAAGSVGRVINIGSNFEISIGETIRLIADIMGKEVEVKTAPARLRPDRSEVERLWADNSLANELLNWRPEYGGLSGLRRGLTETIEWFKNPDNLKFYKPGV